LGGKQAVARPQDESSNDSNFATSKLSPSELLFRNNTGVDSKSLTISKGSNEWFDFVNMRNTHIWKSGSMTDSQWRQITEIFNARSSGDPVIPKKISALKQCLKMLEADIEKRHANKDYDRLSSSTYICYQRLIITHDFRMGWKA
jgi:hypothetical protein